MGVALVLGGRNVSSSQRRQSAKAARTEIGLATWIILLNAAAATATSPRP